MEIKRDHAQTLVELLRRGNPDEREKAAVLIYEEGMQAHKRIMQDFDDKPAA